MIIQGSQVLLAARQESIRQTIEKESLRMWVGNERPDFEGRGRAADAQPRRSIVDAVSLSGKSPVSRDVKAPEDDEAGISAKDQTRILLVEKMVEMFTGRKVKIKPLKMKHEAGAAAPAPVRKEGAEEGAKKAGWGVEYDATVSRYEKDTLRFQASGVVRTADGKEISFDLKLQLSREEYEEASVRLRAGDGQRIDPLVIHFDGSAAQLTDTKFAFDLNGWIDGNDPVYKDLRIWTKDPAGTDVLNTLARQKVGAICLGNVAANFDLKGTGGVENGEMKRLGVWLSEDGGAPGVVSQVDLTV